MSFVQLSRILYHTWERCQTPELVLGGRGHDCGPARRIATMIAVATRPTIRWEAFRVHMLFDNCGRGLRGDPGEEVMTRSAISRRRFVGLSASVWVVPQVALFVGQDSPNAKLNQPGTVQRRPRWYAYLHRVALGFLVLLAFACTGPHYHASFRNDDFRRLALNAILWTAKIHVPAARRAVSGSAGRFSPDTAPQPSGQ